MLSIGNTSNGSSQYFRDTKYTMPEFVTLEKLVSFGNESSIQFFACKRNFPLISFFADFHQLNTRFSFFIQCFHSLSLSFFHRSSTILILFYFLCSNSFSIVDPVRVQYSIIDCTLIRELKSNKVRSIPDLSHCKDLRIL